MPLCACRSRMAWPYRSVLCPPPWDDCGGTEGTELEQAPPETSGLPQGNILPGKHHAQAWIQRKLSSDQKQIFCLSFPASTGKQGLVTEKAVDGVFYIPQSPLCPPRLLQLVSQAQKSPRGLNPSSRGSDTWGHSGKPPYLMFHGPWPPLLSPVITHLGTGTVLPVVALEHRP